MLLTVSLPQKGYFRSEVEKVITIVFSIFKLHSPPNSSLMENYHFLDQICPKRVLPVENRKTNYYFRERGEKVGKVFEYLFRLAPQR